MRLPRTSIALLLLAVPLAGQGYVVLSGVEPGDPFERAARLLARHRRGDVVRFDPGRPAEAVERLRAAAPANVAVVVRPETIDFNFARRFLAAATRLDDDPFVDFAYGFVTGATADEAVAFVKRSIAAERRPRERRIARVAGGVDESRSWKHPFRLRGARVDGLAVWVAGEERHPEEGHDRAFVREHLPRLRSCSVVEFIGHGLPREIVGGPDWRDLAGLELDRAVVLSVGCYGGVTERYFEEDWKAGRLVRKSIPREESFALALLRSGAVGYTAYTCPRPAGPELDTDICALLAGGATLGEARRRDYDKVVLGYVGYGAQRLELPPLEDGAELRRPDDVVRDVMLELGTGGILYGDPALRPFPPRPDEVLVQTRTRPFDGGIAVETTCPHHALWLQCNDPTTKEWGSVAMKVVARVPIGASFVRDVTVEDVTVGGRKVRSRLVWALEEDRGARFAQVKVMFPRQERGGDLVARVRVHTTEKRAEGRAMGGVIRRPRAVSKDVRSNVLQPFMLEAARRFGASRGALQAALDASAAALGAEGLDPAKTRAALGRHGADGFRALCALIQVGHASVHTHGLLELTWRPGEEEHLLELARQDDLPNYGGWVALKGLAVADTPAVRRYLLERIDRERDAGSFMSAAEALALLREPRALKPLAARLLRFDPSFGGVEGRVLRALVKVGGRDAAPWLERYASDARARHRKEALKVLQRIDPAAAKRAREAAGDG